MRNALLPPVSSHLYNFGNHLNLLRISKYLASLNCDWRGSMWTRLNRTRVHDHQLPKKISNILLKEGFGLSTMWCCLYITNLFQGTMRFRGQIWKSLCQWMPKCMCSCSPWFYFTKKNLKQERCFLFVLFVSGENELLKSRSH